MPRKLLLLAASIALGLGVSELLARIWLERFASEEAFVRYASLEQQVARAARTGESPFKYVPHHYAGYIPTPNYVRGKNRHNELGFRGGPVLNPKPEGEFRIVCLGGSTTYTSFVEDHNLSYPSLVERELRERGFTSVRVINAGAEGYTSYESLITFQFRALDLDPDMIVVYHAINDLIARVVWPPWAYRGDNSGNLQHPESYRRRFPVLWRSTLLRILYVRSGGLGPSALANTYLQFAPTGYGWIYITQGRAGTYPQGIFETVDAGEMLRKNRPVYFERNLRNLVAIAREWHVQTVFATFAYSHEVIDPPFDSPTVRGALEEMNQLILTLGRELDVPVFDFAAVFPSTPSLFVGAVHVTEEGSRLKAKLFADYLEASGLLPERR
jgi:hypothetical protein